MRTYLLPVLALCLLAGGPSWADDDEMKTEPAESTTTITLEFREAPVREVITKIAQIAEANIILSPDVDGTVGKLSLRDVPWRAAIEQVARTAGFEVWEEDYDILRIGKPQATAKVLRIYDIRDLIVERPATADPERPDADYLPVTIAPKDAAGVEILRHPDPGVLKVRATPAVQEAFAMQLAALRAKAAKAAHATTDADGRFHLEGVVVGYEIGRSRFLELDELKAQKEAAMQAKLNAQLAVLRAEVSALRTELAEIKAILLREKR